MKEEKRKKLRDRLCESDFENLDGKIGMEAYREVKKNNEK